MTNDDTESFAGGIYPDPDRTITAYDADMGGEGSTASFVTRCKSQQRTAWDKRYTAIEVLNYFRAGYGKELLA